MVLSRKYKTFFSRRGFRTIGFSDEKIVDVVLTAGLRLQEGLYTDEICQATQILRTLPPSKDTPTPKKYNYLLYHSTMHASRNGFVNELGWTMNVLKQLPAENAGYELLRTYSARLWYSTNVAIPDLSSVLYGYTWTDPKLTNIIYRVVAGTIHEKKHRKSTSYF